MKRTVLIALALIFALTSGAFAFNPSRFEGINQVKVDYDPSDPTSYVVKAGFGGEEGWSQFGGHMVVRYLNAGKTEELPLILAAFTTSGVKATQMEIRTDAHRYHVTCTDLSKAGMSSMENEGTLLMTPDSVEMLKDIVHSAYIRVTIWDESPEEAFSFMMDGTARGLLQLFLDEYDQEIVPMLETSSTLGKVYDALTPVVEAEDAEPIGEAAIAVINTQYPTLQNGSSGDEVSRLQQALKDLGFLSGKVDGLFGNATSKALKAFQESIGMNPSGVADQEVQVELFMAALGQQQAAEEAAEE